MAVLDKGLKHAPVRNLNKFDSYIGIQNYVRKINIKKYILSNPPTTGMKIPRIVSEMEQSTLRKNSLYNPQVSDNHHIEVFKKLVLQDLDTLKLKKVSDPIHINIGIQTLTKRKDIVIWPADKGGGVVIQLKEQYQNEIDRQLQDESTYWETQQLNTKKNWRN